MERTQLLLVAERMASPLRAQGLTYRMVLPPSCPSLPGLIQGAARLFIAERLRDRLYLKACFTDCTVLPTKSRIGEPYHIVSGNISTSNYVYSDKPTCRLSPSLIVHEGVPWQLIQLTDEAADQLAEQMTRCSPLVLTLGDALRLNKRALRRWWPTNATTSGVMRMWKLFKRNTTLSELARVSGLDPYETSVAAALMEMGMAFSLKEVVRRMRYQSRDLPSGDSFDGSKRLNAPGLIPLGELELSLDDAGRNGSPIQPTSKDFSPAHEAIVAALARELRAKGYTPLFSPLVDLAVTRGSSLLICEVKTISEDNFLDQVRSAIAQLLEYRFIYRPCFQHIGLAFIAQPPSSNSKIAYSDEFLSNCGIHWVHYRPDQCMSRFIDDALEELSHPTSLGNSDVAS